MCADSSSLASVGLPAPFLKRSSASAGNRPGCMRSFLPRSQLRQVASSSAMPFFASNGLPSAKRLMSARTLFQPSRSCKNSTTV